jgi:DNA replication licensing factor MCM6
LRNEMVERAKAGDKILICGTPIVVPDVTQLYGNNAEVYREATGRAKGNFNVSHTIRWIWW